MRIIDLLGAAVMIDVGTTSMGAGMPGGNGARGRHAHPSHIDDLAVGSDYPSVPYERILREVARAGLQG